MSAADLPQEDASLLAAYARQEEGGLMVDPGRLHADIPFEQFVDRLFLAGRRFKDVDYAVLQGLLHAPDEFAARGDRIRLAAGIVPFAAERRALYKTVRILEQGARAEYAFEQAMLTVEEDPAAGPEARPETRTVKQVPTRLDFDEFVADMWLKGLRFGIDAQAVKAAIRDNTFSRLDVARQLDPTPGSDAEIQEANPDLHRDNSPKVLANGRADLKKFKNRFPHVDEKATLLKKVRRVPGKPGRKVTGEAISPDDPQDFDLHALSGPGTHVVEREDADYIVAELDGFLTLDLGTNQVSVTEKIENRGGISARTTGDLNLAVDEFVEFGEVQEGRVVEGKHMTFKSDVYGTLASLNGNIVVEANLSGGGARSQGGDVTIGGRASCATLEAWDGTVTATYVEGCTISARTVRVERAVNCDIVAHELHLGSSEGCAIVAEFAHLGVAGTRKEHETVLTIAVPDLTRFDEKIVELRKAAAGTASQLEARKPAIDALKAEPEFAKFQALAETLRQGRIKLNEEQQENWRRMESRFATRLRQLQALEAEREALQKQLAAQEADIERIAREREASGRGVGCEIVEVRGETVVQTAKSVNGVGAWRSLGGAELKSRLRTRGAPDTRLFSDDSGNFAWRFKLPETPQA